MLDIAIRNTLTRALVPILWNSDREHAAAMLKQFSEVEFDSGWQYMNAISHVQMPAVKLMLFESMLEEMQHSDAFLKVARALADQRLSIARDARVSLVKCAEDIPHFLALAHESERSICRQFVAYARACTKYPEAAEVFRTIVIDEAKHEHEMRANLVELACSECAVRRLVWQVKLRRSCAAWLRIARCFGDVFSLFCFSLIYFVCGPFLTGFSRRQLRSTPTDAMDAPNLQQPD